VATQTERRRQITAAPHSLHGPTRVTNSPEILEKSHRFGGGRWHHFSSNSREDVTRATWLPRCQRTHEQSYWRTPRYRRGERLTTWKTQTRLRKQVVQSRVKVGLFQQLGQLWLWHKINYAARSGLWFDGEWMLCTRPYDDNWDRHQMSPIMGPHRVDCWMDTNELIKT